MSEDVIEKLTPDLTAGTGEYYSLFVPFVEAPVMFKRDNRYYLLAGADCCACAGGSNVMVYTADHPLGPFTLQADVGSNPSPFNAHIPDHYVTGAQGSDVIRVPGADGALQFLWLGNQWVTAGEPGRRRDQRSALLVGSAIRRPRPDPAAHPPGHGQPPAALTHRRSPHPGCVGALAAQGHARGRVGRWSGACLAPLTGPSGPV